MNRVYFFGDRSIPSYSHCGHFLYEPNGRGYVRGFTGSEDTTTPWKLVELDQGLLVAADQRGCTDERDQVQGLARLHHRDGWTALSLWDRTGDRRSGSNSAIVVEGVHGFDAMVALFEQTFPVLWARITGGGAVVSHPSNPRPEPPRLRVPAVEVRIAETPADFAIVPGTSHVIELEPEESSGEATRRRSTL